jgi:hypothetical protein
MGKKMKENTVWNDLFYNLQLKYRDVYGFTNLTAIRLAVKAELNITNDHVYRARLSHFANPERYGGRYIALRSFMKRHVDNGKVRFVAPDFGGSQFMAEDKENALGISTSSGTPTSTQSSQPHQQENEMNANMITMHNDETVAVSQPLTALESIAVELDTVEWKYTKSDKTVEFRFPAKPFTGQCVVRVCGDHCVLILVTLGLFVPETARPAMRRLMNRENWDLMMGNLEMDEEDGEVRFRYTYPLVAGQLDGERAVESIMQLCSLSTKLAPELLQASADSTKSCTNSAGTALIQ